MTSSLAREARELVKDAEAQGFRVKPKKKGWMVLTPNGRGSVMIHKTPSDPASNRNARARLRKYGYKG